MASSDDEGEDDDDEEEEITLAQKLAKSTNQLRTISYHPCFELGEVLGQYAERQRVLVVPRFRCRLPALHSTVILRTFTSRICLLRSLRTANLFAVLVLRKNRTSME